MRLSYTFNTYSERILSAVLQSPYLQITYPKSNVGGVPQFRVYKDGDAPGPFIPFPTQDATNYYSNTVNLVTGFIYRAEVQNSEGITAIGSTYASALDEGCFSLPSTPGDTPNGYGVRVFVTDVGVYVFVSIGGPSTVIRNVGIGLNGSPLKPGTGPSLGANWTNSELEALGITGDINEIIIRRDSVSCSEANVTNIFLDKIVVPPLNAGYTKTNETAAANDDGTITLSVTGGSGNFSYLWSDGSILQNRVNLASGFYSVVITDTVTAEDVSINDIQITEPAVPPSNIGTILRAGMLNSLTFVRDSETDQCDNPQAFDNVLFCKQEYEGFMKANYYQLVDKCDAFPAQFESDFLSHAVRLFEYGTDIEVRMFDVLMVEQNIGKTQDFNITIKAGDIAGKSKILFSSGILPLPLSVGGVFTIINNADGFNGDYAITDIIANPMNNQQYLVINKLYDLPYNSSSATGRFLSDASDYNVFEAALNFVGLPDGIYYARIDAFSDNSATLTSEPVDLAEEHPGSVEVIYRNNDDGYGDITWSTGITCKVRLPGHVGHQRLPGGERSTSRNSDFSITKVNAKKTRGFILQVWMLPPYMHEKCSVIFDCDYWLVNRVECQSTDAYADPKYIEEFLLANSEIKIQQKGWFKKYNSNDLGSVNESFILTETGFIKR